jgi:hypothetical protein
MSAGEADKRHVLCELLTVRAAVSHRAAFLFHRKNVIRNGYFLKETIASDHYLY